MTLNQVLISPPHNEGMARDIHRHEICKSLVSEIEHFLNPVEANEDIWKVAGIAASYLKHISWRLSALEADESADILKAISKGLAENSNLVSEVSQRITRWQNSQEIADAMLAVLCDAVIRIKSIQFDADNPTQSLDRYIPSNTDKYVGSSLDAFLSTYRRNDAAVIRFGRFQDRNR